MDKTYTLLPHVRRSRIYWLGFVLLLGLTTFYTFWLMAGQNNFNPWVPYSIHQTYIASELVVEGSRVVWADWYSLSQPGRIYLKDLETGLLHDLSSHFPCNPIGSDFGDLALHGEWLVGSFSCNYPASYDIYALNLNSLELVHILPPPGLPPGQTYADEPAIYGNLVVWKQRDWTWSQSELFLFDLQSRTVSTITTPPPSTVDWHPDIYQDWLAWYRLNLDTGERFVRLLNLSSSEQITLPIITEPITWISLDDQYVIWPDWRNGNSDIYGYDLISRHEVALITGPFNQGKAIINDGVIFYHDHEPPRTLRMYHLNTQQAYIIYEQLPNHSLQQHIDFDLGTAVWTVVAHTAPSQWTIYAAQQLPERFYLPVLGHP
ncbi:MAG: hypothetical protein KJ063_18000 [Anaerolineae bacterium]|nr:hypothetical protein [Anaerolineae bacterium]